LVESIEQLKVTSVSVLPNSNATDPVLVLGGADEMKGVATVVSTTHITVRVPLTLPARSKAVTARECDPSARPVNDRGLVHVVATAPSSEQRYDPMSVDALLNVMLALVELVGEDGCDTVGVLGAVRSTVQDAVAALLGFRPVAWALTLNVCAPTARPV
jgi:hypothetical protein